MIGFWTYCGFSHQRSPPPCWQFMRKKIGGSDIFMQSFFGSISSHQMVLRYCTVYFLLLCNRFIWQQKSSYPPFYKYYITIYTSDISIKRNKTFTYMFLQDVENFKHNFFCFYLSLKWSCMKFCLGKIYLPSYQVHISKKNMLKV